MISIILKKLNDEKGHDHGDLVLQQTGEIMRRILNGNGFGVRYGGEELIGLVTNTMHTARLAEKNIRSSEKRNKNHYVNWYCCWTRLCRRTNKDC
ncbi:diguanylate cyclase (plasmid) [Lysinibacillus sp. MHQ-1]|nr:diguanylate cyclase [Lysinibacillus sp. MHQ-1]